LTPIRALAVANLRTSSTFAAEADPAKTLRTLVEQNVCAQVSNVASSSVVKNAWRQGKTLTVHGKQLDWKLQYKEVCTNHACPGHLLGWVYDIASGKIEDLKVSEGSAISNEEA
jgi:carbonic anhydrase